MRTKSVKVDKHYMYKGEIRRVLKRIKNKQKHSANITRFLLDTGDKVFASELEEVKHE